MVERSLPNLFNRTGLIQIRNRDGRFAGHGCLDSRIDRSRSIEQQTKPLDESTRNRWIELSRQADTFPPIERFIK